MFESIPILNRVILIDDAGSLASVGRLDYRVFFDLLSYMRL